MREMEADDIMQASLLLADASSAVPTRAKNVNHERVNTSSYMTLEIAKLATLKADQQKAFEEPELKMKEVVGDTAPQSWNTARNDLATLFNTMQNSLAGTTAILETSAGKLEGIY